MAQVWAISTNKGGVLKTSLTTNLAGLLSEERKVLIVDTDNQGNCAVTFGRNPDDAEPSLYNVLVEGLPAEKAIVPVYGHPNLDLLQSNDDMAFFDFEVLADAKKFGNPFHILRNALEPLKAKYDFILVDSPPNMGLVQGNIFCFVDQVLVPFQPEPYSMRSLVKTINAITDFKEQHNPNLSILGVVPTLVDLRTVLHPIILRECREFCNERDIHVFDTVIPRSIRYAASVAYDNRPVTLSNQRNQHSLYANLLTEVFEKCEKV